MTGYTFDPSIVREYDMRGIVDKTLSEDDLYAIGRSFGTIVSERGGSTVGVCYDGRHSSPRFSKALYKGLTESGINVENYGLGPTPLSYYALNARGLDGAISITGSHNPPDYNGIKFSLRDEAVYGARIREIAEIATEGRWSEGEGVVTEVDLYEEYVDRLAGDYVGGEKPLKIAWDAGNGAPGVVLKKLTDRLPGEHILLFEDVDGDFPNHHPDPQVAENLVELIKVVKEKECDFGVAFDGDGDRIGAVDRHGHIIPGDQLTALYAKEMMSRVDNPTVILDVKCSQAVSDTLSKWGANPMIWKTGHSLAKAKLKETNAELAGELSGHIFFNEGFYGQDDGLYCAIRLMNTVQSLGDLHELHQIFPETFDTPEIRFEVEEERKFAIIDEIKELIEDEMPEADCLDIDGVRVSTDDGWFLIRASNTQNVLSLRLEGQSQEKLEKLRKVVVHLLNKVSITPPTALAA